MSIVPTYALKAGTPLNTVHRVMPITNIALSVINGILPAVRPTPRAAATAPARERQ